MKFLFKWRFGPVDPTAAGAVRFLARSLLSLTRDVKAPYPVTYYSTRNKRCQLTFSFFGGIL